MTTTIDLPQQSSTESWFLSRLDATHIETTPVPYAVIDSVFPSNVFRQIREELPSSSLFAEARGAGRFTSYCRKLTGTEATRRDIFFSTRSAENRGLSPFWTDLASWLGTPAMRDRLIAHFLPAELHPKDSGVYQIDLRLVRETGAVYIAPHLDQPRKLMVIVIYLCAEAAPDSGTSLLEPTGVGAEFREITRVPFTANTAFVLPRTEHSWHGVAAQRLPSPRTTLHLYIQRPG